ncbi:DNA mismatch repair endonuclease MutL [candidate division WOR-3 bacterium]|uniref:DNA mismatch repair protein MutL n=1 Tax=candidate division WOR-3 bacterium TaxID=2052148 RepID=A0A9D5K8L9_UNCW3|nr:DNA mismatch repair endonuclease MutL [candidate division WOR-3 bacterium]MBD3364473.1 DNA mismatch repair endonuclease MutL [candidate division WOR-3 bacterium]
MSIRILSAETAAKIAAGEVIIRPASAVKELIENSLDAGAKKIEVYLKEGGKRLVKVVDDGEGIPSDEVELTIKRFATSKLASAGDLVRISSYGFRGEALASMAEVSELTVETQQEGTQSGIILRVKAGKVIEKKETVRSRGTTVSVSNLFFNLPARRSFLRGESYERRMILAVVRNYALLHPEIRFEVRTPKRKVAEYTSCRDWLERIKSVYPKLKSAELIPLNQKHRLLSIEGYIIRPDQSLEIKKLQRIFFNNRPVIYRAIYRAVIEGFGPQPDNVVPFFILKLNSPADMLDSNIHPAKTEVRYRDERFLFDFVSQAVRQAVHKEAVSNLTYTQLPSYTHLRPYPKSLTHPTQPRDDSAQLNMHGNRQSSPPTDPAIVSGSYKYTEDTGGETADTPLYHASFWQLQETYILAQVSSGLIIVDQHAAHERILFEEMLTRLWKTPRQRLLFPLIVELNPEEYAIFEEITDYLPELGLEAKPFGPDQIMIETLPADAKMGPAELSALFTDFVESSEVKLGNREKMAAFIACHGAIKAGQRLSQQEMESLINRLFRCETPYFCPHGRPTVIKFTMSDLDKRFGRF